MARRVFFSFHYKPDAWRASKVRNIGAIEGNKSATDNDWEAVTEGGGAAIKRWINNQLSGRSCTIVLIGEKTAGRKWINYEIAKSFEDGKGLLGIHIHRLKDHDGDQSSKGDNPFAYIETEDGTPLSSLVEVYNPPYRTSKDVYEHIEENLEDWIEEAVNARAHY